MRRLLVTTALAPLTFSGGAEAKTHHHAAKAVATYDNVKTNVGSIDTHDANEGFTCEPEQTEVTCRAAYDAMLRDNAEARVADVTSMKLDKMTSRMHCPDDEICMVTVPIDDDASVANEELDAYRTKRLVEALDRLK